MRWVSIFLLLFLGTLGMLLGQQGVPQGFGYQVLVFESGSPVRERRVDLELSLQTMEGKVYFIEVHKGLRTGTSGEVSVMVGEGSALKGTFGDVPWSEGIWISGRVDFGSGMVSLGSPVQLQAAPYALFALATPRVVGNVSSASEDAPIFEVKNSQGHQVFGVYEGGVRIKVTDDLNLPENAVRGFTLSSRSIHTATGEEEFRDRLRVDAGGVHFLVDEEEDRGVRGGFAVSTRSRAFEEAVLRFSLSQGEASFLMDDMEDRGVRGGFAVSSRLGFRGEAGELSLQERFIVREGGINFVVDPSLRGVRGGFAVSSRMQLRGESEHTEDLFVMNSTESYFTVRKKMSAGFSLRDRIDARKTLLSVSGDGMIGSLDGDANKILKPDPSNLQTKDIVVLASAQGLVGNGCPWMIFSVIDKKSNIEDRNVRVFLPDDKLFTRVAVRMEGGVEVAGIKLKDRVSVDRYVDTSEHKIRVCLMNAPEICARVEGGIQLTSEWIEKEQMRLSSIRWEYSKAQNELKLVVPYGETWSIWGDIQSEWKELVRNNAKVRFETSIEGLHGEVNDEGRLVCTNRDTEFLTRVRNLPEQEVTLTLMGDVFEKPLEFKSVMTFK